MSANLYWQPVATKKHDLNVSAPSSFMETMDRVFKSRTPKLGESDIVRLETLRDATDNAQFANAYQDLLDAIQMNGEVQMIAEY